MFYYFIEYILKKEECNFYNIFSFKGGVLMENIFNVKYNSKLDRLEIPSENGKFKLLKFFKNHKFFSTVLISFFIFSGINFYLIFSFMKMLENI